MWWGGFLLCGFLLILVAIPFFSFPKVLTREKEKIRLVEKAAAALGASASKPPPKPQTDIKDTGYGKDIKGIVRNQSFFVIRFRVFINLEKILRDAYCLDQGCIDLSRLWANQINNELHVGCDK